MLDWTALTAASLVEYPSGAGLPALRSDSPDTLFTAHLFNPNAVGLAKVEAERVYGIAIRQRTALRFDLDHIVKLTVWEIQHLPPLPDGTGARAPLEWQKRYDTLKCWIKARDICLEHIEAHDARTDAENVDALRGCMGRQRSQGRDDHMRAVLSHAPQASAFDAKNFLSNLGSRGINVAPDDVGGFRVCPSGLLTESDRNLLRMHKGKVVQALGVAEVF